MNFTRQKRIARSRESFAGKNIKWIRVYGDAVCVCIKRERTKAMPYDTYSIFAQIYSKQDILIYEKVFARYSKHCPNRYLLRYYYRTKRLPNKRDMAFNYRFLMSVAIPFFKEFSHA